MNIDTKLLIDELASAKHQETKQVLRRLVVKSLSPIQKQAYDYLLSWTGNFRSSMEVSEHLGKPLNQTGNVLKVLHSFGLVTKNYIGGPTGIHCIYKIKD